MTLSTYYKGKLVDATERLLVKALVNDSIEVPELNITKYPDSITVEMNLPTDLVVTRIDFLDDQDQVVTSITGIEIDTSVSTIFSHNIHFMQGVYHP